MQVARTLREQILRGFLRPGAHLSEESLASGLGVSRNTIREAFRLLSRERLVVHELNKGVSVAVPGIEDLADVYRVRRVVETAAAAMADSASLASLAAVRAAVNDGQRAAATGDWARACVADIAFHQAVTGLAGSTRLAETMRGALAELRLCCHIMAAPSGPHGPSGLHGPYLARNEQVAVLIESGVGASAARELDAYLAEAAVQGLAAYQAAREGIRGLPADRGHWVTKALGYRGRGATGQPARGSGPGSRPRRARAASSPARRRPPPGPAPRRSRAPAAARPGRSPGR